MEKLLQNKELKFGRVFMIDNIISIFTYILSPPLHLQNYPWHLVWIQNGVRKRYRCLGCLSMFSATTTVPSVALSEARHVCR